MSEYTVGFSGFAPSTEHLMELWLERAGLGVCGIYAAHCRANGIGQIAACFAQTATDDCPFGHYVIVTNGTILDFCNPFDDEELFYTEIEVLDWDEMPDCVDDKDVEWANQVMADYYQSLRKS